MLGLVEYAAPVGGWTLLIGMPLRINCLVIMVGVFGDVSGVWYGEMYSTWKMFFNRSEAKNARVTDAAPQHSMPPPPRSRMQRQLTIAHI